MATADTTTTSPVPSTDTAVHGAKVILSSPGQVLLWAAVFALAGLWIQNTWFPEEPTAEAVAAPTKTDDGGNKGNGALSPAVLAALNAAEGSGEIEEGGSEAGAPIAARDGKNKQGLVNLFKRVYNAVAGDDASEKAPAEDSTVAALNGADDTPPPKISAKDFGEDVVPENSNAPTADAAGNGAQEDKKPAETSPQPKIVDAAPANEKVDNGKVEEFIDKRRSFGDEVVPIEDPHNAMKPFYDSLKRTENKESGAITRIIQFGDSTIVADKITGTLRRKFQERFGDSGHGWLLVGKPWDYYIHSSVNFSAHENWRLNRLTSNPLDDKRHGLGGVTSRGVGTGLWADFKTTKKGTIGKSISRFDLYYMTHPRGGKVAIDVDGVEQIVVPTQSTSIEDKIASITFPDGPHKVRVRIASAGEVRLYGVAMGRDTPGVTYDSLGVTGIRAKTFVHRMDENHFKGQLKYRDPSLVVVMLGTNESEFESMDMAEYEKEYEMVIKRIREALPDKSCLVASPPDRAKKNKMGRMTTAVLIPKMVEIQRKVAHRNKCAFWNTFEAMGGKGSMASWYRNKPRLSSGDFTHFTAAGGEVLGILFYDALLASYPK